MDIHTQAIKVEVNQRLAPTEFLNSKVLKGKILINTIEQVGSLVFFMVKKALFFTIAT